MESPFQKLVFHVSLSVIQHWHTVSSCDTLEVGWIFLQKVMCKTTLVLTSDMILHHDVCVTSRQLPGSCGFWRLETIGARVFGLQLLWVGTVFSWYFPVALTFSFSMWCSFCQFKQVIQLAFFCILVGYCPVQVLDTESDYIFLATSPRTFSSSFPIACPSFTTWNVSANVWDSG